MSALHLAQYEDDKSPSDARIGNGVEEIKLNSVKTLFEMDQPAIGSWITLCPHPRMIAIFAAAELDFVIIDMEHTDFDMATVGQLVLQARACGLVPFVRPPGTSNEHALTRPLDAGALGLLLPNIETADQLTKIVAQTHYHPQGHRPLNPAGPHTDYHQGEPLEIVQHVNAQTMLIAMIETQRGIDNLASICDVDGLDAIFVGPHDLSQDLGVPGQKNHPLMIEAVNSIQAVCRDKGMKMGMSCDTPEKVTQRLDEGVTWIPYKTDATMIIDAVMPVIPELKRLVKARV